MLSDWFYLFVGLVLVYWAVQGLRTGETGTFNGWVSRSEHPFFYWFHVILSAILGVSCVVAVFLGLLLGNH